MRKLQPFELPVLAAGCLALAVAATQVMAAGPKPQNELEQIFYDIGVIGYCGLTTDAVTRGFNRQLEGLLGREKTDTIRVRDARNDALTMVEWEWDNRGLGGFRGWCKNEGKAAVERFTD